MKPFNRMMAAIALVLALSFVGFETRADSPGQMIDEKNAEQDAALKQRADVDKAIGLEIIDLKEQDARIESELAAGAAINAAQSDSLKSLAASVASLEARVAALEEGGPVDPPDPEPALPWALFLVDLDAQTKTPFVTDTISAPAGRYTIQIGEGDTNEEKNKLPDAPFYSLVNGAACTDVERNPKYQICGDNREAPFVTGANAVAIEGRGTGKTVALTVTLAAAPDPDPGPDPNPEPGQAKMQVGPWGWQFSIEEPFINMQHATRLFWEGCGKNTAALLAEGVIDDTTGLPLSTPCALNTQIFFPPGTYNAQWDGEWAVVCKGGAANLSIWDLPADLQKQTSPERMVFTHNERTRDHFPVRISQMTKPCEDFALLRTKNEAAWKAGKIYNPDFLEAMSGYDIIRAMDLQSANPAVIRSVDDLATMDAMPWLSADWQNEFENPFQGMPLEAVFALGVEADKELWFQAPMTLGAPQPFFEFKPEDGRTDVWAWRFGQSAGLMAPEVLASEEWDRYADAFVAALIESGYPEDRTLYVSLANEVWNFAGHYFLTTVYAQRMGEGLGDYLGIPEAWDRHAYGAMLARFSLAVDAAMERAGRNQKLIYVVEGQAANVDTTPGALRGAKAYMELHGEVWADHAPDFGVSIASYWGWQNPADFGVDADNLPALEDWLINGPANEQGTLANVVAYWKAHEREAAKYGVKLIGAYEGGPHFGRPWRMGDDGKRIYEMTQANYQEFIWGERGARVNYEVNKALAKAFPGTILSNYVLAGPTGGQPWFEGPLGADNPYAKSWDQLIEEFKQ